MKTVVAVSPDAGGAKRAEEFRQALGHLLQSEIGLAQMEKYRSSGVVSGSLLAGDVAGKIAIIVDDLISTGGTLVRTAEACREAGASRTYAAAAHGLWVGGAPELLECSSLAGIAVTNTVPPEDRIQTSIVSGRVSVIDASDAIARAIAACHEEF